MADATTHDFATFGALLKYLRRRAHLTQQELGVAVGYSEAYITRLEGDTRLPNVSMVQSVFVDALHLEREPELARRLIALAETAREREGDKPAARLSGPRQSNLPVHLSRFIGREAELQEVLRLLRSNRLVTLTGSGGVGKTRLALEAAGALSAEFGDGARMVEFAPLADPALAPQTVSLALGVSNHAAYASIEAVCSYLADKRVLIVFDNCEHLVEACARLADAILRACPHARMLATSREALRIPGEITWRVPSLTAADAASLFADRATAARPAFALSDRNEATVAAISARLDGIPLAIELAASRLSGLSLEQLASRLSDRFSLLTDGSRTALPRHRTLRALIDWSHDLLTDQQRILFRRLAVFVGGFSAEAAERVCAVVDGPTPESKSLYAANVVPLLLDLVDKSLVVTDDTQPDMRYRVLETIHEYAREQLLAADEVEYFRARHARYFAALARDTAPQAIRSTSAAVHFTLGIDFDPWLTQIALDIDNLRAALRWALGEGRDPGAGADLALWLYQYWTMRGPPSEAVAWLERAIELLPPGEDELRRARLLSAIADFSGNIGNQSRAESAGVEALALLRRLPDRFDLMRVLQMRTSDLMQRARYDEAAIHVEEWLAIARSRGDTRYEAIGLFWLGLQYLNRREFARAEALMDESVRTVPPGDHGTLMTARAHQALVWLWGRGEADRARPVLAEVVRYYRETGFEFGIATVLLWLGDIDLLRSELSSARARYAESASILHRLGTYQRIVRPMSGAAALAAVEGRPTRAVTLWEAATALRTAMGWSDLPMAHNVYLVRVASARAAMSREALEAAETAGRAMTVDMAVAYLLAD